MRIGPVPSRAVKSFLEALGRGGRTGRARCWSRPRRAAPALPPAAARVVIADEPRIFGDFRHGVKRPLGGLQERVEHRARISSRSPAEISRRPLPKCGCQNSPASRPAGRQARCRVAFEPQAGSRLSARVARGGSGRLPRTGRLACGFAGRLSPPSAKRWSACNLPRCD